MNHLRYCSTELNMNYILCLASVYTIISIVHEVIFGKYAIIKLESLTDRNGSKLDKSRTSSCKLPKKISK